MSSPERPSEPTANSKHNPEWDRLLVRVSRGLARDLGKLNVFYEPGVAVAVTFAGLEHPVFVSVQAAGENPVLSISLCVDDNVDWRNTPGLAGFLLRENATLAFGRLGREEDALVLEHNLFPSATAREVSILTGLIANTAVDLHAELTHLGALKMVEED